MLARNAVPVVGVYAFDWSTALVVCEVWFDGVTALGAMLAFQTAATLGRDPDAWTPPPGLPRVPPVILGPLFWLMPFLILGLPYWFALGALHASLIDAAFWTFLAGAGGIQAALAGVLVSNVVEYRLRDYGRMGDREIRLGFDWAFHMHLARVVVLLGVGLILPLGGILAFMLALSYVEIYPLRFLRLLGSETLDEENRARRRD